jgi:hypothetical protein
MKAHGRVMRGCDMPSPHPAWERVMRWTKRAFTRRNMKVAVGIAIAVLLFGLMIWACYQSIETLNTAEFPHDLSIYQF